MKKKLSLKDKIYAENLIKFKGNQTRAYQETYPNSEYGSSRASGVRKTKKLLTKGNIFKLSKITAEYVLERLDTLAHKARKDSDKVRCLELLGKFRALFTDKVEQKTEIYTKEQKEELLHRLGTHFNKLN